MNHRRILSLGAGVQSSTVAMLIERGELPPIDGAIFADTGAEPSSVYRWLDWLESQLSFPVWRVQHGDLSQDGREVRQSKKTGRYYLKTEIPFFVRYGPSGKGMLPRKCTCAYKLNPIERHVRTLLHGRSRRATVPLVDQLLGISTDEAHRMKDARVKYIRNVYPLVELGWSRQDCLNWWQAEGLPAPPRSACYFCPYKSDAEWMRLRADEPDSFQAAVQFERDVQRLVSQWDLFTRGELFLHSARIPLDQVFFEKDRQLDLFGNECEGMCGV